MPRLLSLFDGTGSITKPFKEGWEVQSLDCDGRFGCTIVEDILLWDYSKEPTPDVIFSGVPCEQYSQARTTGGPRNYLLADKLVNKSWEIITYFLNKNEFLIFSLKIQHFHTYGKGNAQKNLKIRVLFVIFVVMEANIVKELDSRQIIIIFLDRYVIPKYA